MNPAKLLEDVFVLIRKYSPILIIHALVLFWISAWVLDLALLPHGSTIWAELTAHINAALKVLGISLQLWYVFTALLIAYMATFEWVRSLLIRLPILRPRYLVRYPPEFLGEAGKVLRAEPDPWKVNEQLNNLITQYTQELRDKNQALPDQWQRDRENRYISYYGTLLVMCGACIAWAAAGGPLARSPIVVWRLALLIGLAAFLVRWRTQRVIDMGRRQLGYWALREFTRRNPNDREDPLQYERRHWIEKQARFDRTVRRDPPAALRSLLYLLPQFLRNKLSDRLRYSPWWASGESWEILASWKMKQQDEKYAPPEALKVDAMAKHFRTLLECTGAGLCILAPRQLALAPGVEQGGSVYSLAKRRHAGTNGLRLIGRSDLSRCEFAVDTFGADRAFLAEIGDLPIASLAQGDFPFTMDRQWGSLTSKKFASTNWPEDQNQVQSQDQKGKVIGGIPIARRLPVHPGSSYLMRAKSPGAEYVAVFQCFQIQDTAKVLIAWRILYVFLTEEEAPKVLPYWNPSAWKGIWKESPDSAAKLKKIPPPTPKADPSAK